ncbi:TPA_asm: N [Anthurium amnicola virus 1]|uniref:Nucleoprotein n=2 Tax=root TaxID=1 RepID=A0A8D9PH89_9RHAB|nr:N [Anthurium amnicola virus 1] [Anthurium amnicola virus 1]DAF42309.1 TPA_asm: N [Anthurium amnicola virus 1]
MAGKKIENRYASMPDDISTSVIPDKKFVDSEFLAAKTYKLTAASDIDMDNMVILLKNWLYSTKSDYTAYLILKMAASIKKYSRGRGYEMVFPTSVEGEYDMSNDILQAISQRMEVPDSGNAETSEQTEEDILFSGSGQSEVLTIGTGDSVFAPFLAAFLLKMIIKSADNVTASWNPMKARFKNFFNKSAPEGWPSPSKAILEDIRATLSADPIIGRTWCKMIAVYEHSEVDHTETGMMRYLAFLQLGYAGMHALKLLLQVKQVGKYQMGWLMGEMAYPETIPALDEIHMIGTKFEKHDKNTRYTPYFKYARIISPEYFQKVQTKNCPALVYLLVSILNEVQGGGEGYQNPENIVGISSLGANLKEKLRLAAVHIVESAPLKNDALYSGTMKKFLGGSSSSSQKEEELFS